MQSRYRSTTSYLSAWKREHRWRGHRWAEHLTTVFESLKRAANRGLGPPKRARAHRAEELPRTPNPSAEPLNKGGPMFPYLMVSIGIAWILRGAELAALLGEQAATNSETRYACLDLGPTKTDPGGRGCERPLQCICQTETLGPCPFCSVSLLREQRAAKGLGPKDPLFPTKRGKAANQKAVVRTIRLVLQSPLSSEHTLRRSGAQWYARRLMPVYLIQFLARWGGPTVFIYVEEALRGQLALASARAVALPSDGPVSWEALRKEVREIVRASAPSRTEEEAVPPQRLLHTAALLGSGTLPAGAPSMPTRRVQGRREQAGAGKIHRVLLCDPLLAPDTWLTRCGWAFGLSDHILLEGSGSLTCKRCIQQERSPGSGSA